MRNLDSIAFDDNGNVKLINAWGKDIIEDKDIIVHREKGYELMQYTGLIDKNGKEIYEGDILQFYNDVDYILKPSYIEVVFENGAFCCKHFKYETEYLGNLDVTDMDITVAGNIYQNPESLEVDNIES